ncbi:hypothetical protein PE066_11635 [Ramlibacter tataouinensis]|uniref:hypothetical protein n=1 Tax=Ramlibacter tataouinensis TaxID=94132 RepID=UPI0022F380BD|nr:hypothetical protein [Ramlibacter tataouinensis]WBY00132.1 hypothetical protein PE066_11635 [Ramlibacter tataouinensis]
MAAMTRGALIAAAALLAACAALEPAPPAPVAPQPAALPAADAPDGPDVLRLQCDGGLQLRLRVRQDEVQVDGLPGGREVLLRDAGGVTDRQSVYSNEHVRAEFGLGAQASEAVVHLLQPQPHDLNCRRD